MTIRRAPPPHRKRKQNSTCKKNTSFQGKLSRNTAPMKNSRGVSTRSLRIGNVQRCCSYFSVPFLLLSTGDSLHPLLFSCLHFFCSGRSTSTFCRFITNVRRKNSLSQRVVIGRSVLGQRSAVFTLMQTVSYSARLRNLRGLKTSEAFTSDSENTLLKKSSISFAAN